MLLLQNLHKKRVRKPRKREWKRIERKQIHCNKISIRHIFDCRCAKCEKSDTHSENDNWNYFCVLFFGWFFSLFCCYPTRWNVDVGKLCLLEITTVKRGMRTKWWWRNHWAKLLTNQHMKINFLLFGVFGSISIRLFFFCFLFNLSHRNLCVIHCTKYLCNIFSLNFFLICMEKQKRDVVA